MEFSYRSEMLRFAPLASARKQINRTVWSAGQASQLTSQKIAAGSITRASHVSLGVARNRNFLDSRPAIPVHLRPPVGQIVIYARNVRPPDEREL